MKGLTPRRLAVTLIAALAGMASLPTASFAETPSVSSFPTAPNPFFLPEDRPFGDTFPFFKDGVWHLFCMWMPQFGHFVSRDLVHWEKRPPTPFGGATGCVVEHGGRYYFFYTGNQNICLATSTNLEQWTQHPGNPVVSGDNKLYVTTDFRDAFVFFNQAERQWWMLFGTRQPDRPAQRGGCVGVAKSQDLLRWQLAPPLWAPDIGPHTDCPQVIQHSNRWYLIYLQRHTRYRVADSLSGPWRRPPIRDLGTKFSAAGSRPASDGRRWVSFPFIVNVEGQTDLGQWGYGGPLAVPRQWDFLDDGSILDVFIADRATLTHRLYSHRGGQAALEFRDTSGAVSNLLVRRLE